ncbi:energy transducer TonB [Hyphococcus sp.]|uniref:energy transducer TonB n=1 Tax=Hyphococcus sp. TaxID=2038636 RepID=UPI002085DA78|nr:MAG: hypothetical protein DHS20C04_05500 [Marinicaulis sp.]
MFQKSFFFSLVAWFLTASAPVFAQSYFYSLDQHARIEQADPILMHIGAAEGRAYFRALNLGTAPAVARIFIERIANEKTGETERFIQLAPVGSYEAGEMVYLDELSAGKSWVTGWEVASVASAPARPADRDERPFYRMPPRYPVECMDDAIETEHVLINYDVTAKGRLENIVIRGVTDGCFALATQRFVSQWWYAPKIENGEPVARRHLETQITFVLED